MQGQPAHGVEADAFFLASDDNVSDSSVEAEVTEAAEPVAVRLSPGVSALHIAGAEPETNMVTSTATGPQGRKRQVTAGMLQDSKPLAKRARPSKGAEVAIAASAATNVQQDRPKILQHQTQDDQQKADGLSAAYKVDGQKAHKGRMVKQPSSAVSLDAMLPGNKHRSFGADRAQQRGSKAQAGQALPARAPKVWFRCCLS